MIAGAVAGGRGHELLDEAARSPDVEPLCRLLEALDDAGSLSPSVGEALRARLPDLGDPQLQYLLRRCAERPTLRALAAPIAEAALTSWPLSRVGALVLMSRWLRRHDARSHEALSVSARARLEAPEPGADDGRALLFVTGLELEQLGRRPAWRPLVRSTVRELLDALARAPKSISQANAEALLSRHVYVDPGHFFFELLQNADDAGAKTWQAHVRADSVRVTHDGAPFDLRDVVGVLSIGQTTKRADQIGFFGVGFKSVYEICERPRVHSGVFDFEIAHVSIPRELAERPGHVLEGETALELPFAGDPAPEPDELFARAAAIPPETLLTLPNLRELEVRGRGRSLSFRAQHEGDEVRLLAKGSGHERRFHCARGELHYEGERELGRARHSPVLVAIELADDGAPQASRGPTLFSFLPTAERTGLRFLVHARFDVTVDRERLTGDSPWNRELLTEAGRTLASAAVLFAERGHSPLGILPAREELASEDLGSLFAAVTSALAERPLLELARGDRVAPKRARRVEPPELARALADLDLGSETFALAPLPAREARVALDFGAACFSTADLASLLERELSAGSPAPAWFDDAREVVLSALDDGSLPAETLRALPLLRDGAARLCTAAEATMDSTLWSRLYAGVRCIVTPEELAALPPGLRRALAVPAFERGALVADLGRDARRRALLASEAELFGALAQLGAEADALRSTALLRDRGGLRRTAEQLCRLDPELTPLGAGITGSVPLLAEDLEREHAELCSRWVPCFDVAALVEALHDGFELDDETTERLYDLLDARVDRIAPRLARRLASAPAHPDVRGARRCLVSQGGASQGRALLAGEEGLRELLPEGPWARCSGRAFLRALPTKPFGAAELVAALAGSADASLVVDERLPEVYRWLAARAGRLPRQLGEDLAAKPAWLATDGQRYPLSELRRAPESAAVAAFYDELGARPLAHEACLPLVSALRLDARLPAADLVAVVRELTRLDGAPEVDRGTLAEVLREAAGALPPEELEGLVAVPLFLDEDGQARALGHLRDASAGACHRAGAFREELRPGALPLLAADEERRFEALLAAVGPEPATARDLAARLAIDPLLLADQGAGERARRALVGHTVELDDEARSQLADVPLFSDASGQARSTGEFAVRSALEALLGEPLIAAFELEDALLAAPQEAERGALGLAPLTARGLLERRVLPRLLDGEPLDAQPVGARSRRALGRLIEAAATLDVDPLEHALVLDAELRLVTGARLGASPSERALCRWLPLRSQFADEAWLDALSPELRARVAPPMAARVVASALRQACPDEAPRADHPVLCEACLEGLYDWLRERGAEIGDDPDATAALGAAAVLPSQRGSLRAPRQLVLDPQIPDLGLDWGLGDDVPDDVAAWLGRVYELERGQRRKLAEHVLDGLDEATAHDDKPRAAELLCFLARALGAPGDAERLEQRARRTKVYARLRVPTGRGTWEKPRRLWIASDDEAAEVLTFLYEPPSRVELRGLDAGARALLVACGARDDLDPVFVESCLASDGRKDGAGAPVALARYIARSALATPERRQRWKLDARPWVPDRTGRLRRPEDLYWPDATVDALLGEADELLPDESLVYGVPGRLGQWLAFRHGDDVRLTDVAAHADERGTPDATLAWLEAGLRARRFSSTEVERELGPRLRLRDASGRLRAPDELAVTGARALFGSLRGDWSAGAKLSMLARALRIPPTPDATMVLEFLEEVGDVLAGGADEALQHELAMRLPECLAALARRGTDAELALPEGAALAGLLGGSVVLVRVGDPRLCMLDPPELAEGVDADALTRAVEPMPAVERSQGLRALLLRSGVPDLHGLLRVERVQPGPVDDRRGASVASLGRRLAPLLAGGTNLALVDGLVVRGRLAEPIDATFEARLDAALHDGTLWLTHAALEDPSRLSPALAPDPLERARITRWLSEPATAAPCPPEAPKAPRGRAPRPESVRGERGFFHRVRRLFGGGEEADAPDASTPRSKGRRGPEKRNGENFFQPSETLGSQLDGTEGWLESRLERPDFGLAFVPASLPAPWVYASKMLASRFDRSGQLWRRGPVAPASSRGDVGTVVFRGRLPEGVAVLPVPTFGRVAEVDIRDAQGDLTSGSDGTTMLRLDGASRVTLRMTLGQAPDLASCRPAADASALRSFVPDKDLPDEVHDFLASLDTDEAPAVTASAVRDFVRARYRYDPSYLEDPNVARFLARVTRGRASAHIAALHVSADERHLGAGVCYELGSLACELMRRAGVPAAITTGWVLNGGTLSEPDHLWAVALLVDANGEAVRLPIDASTTRDGRPLRVPRRAPGSFRAPKDPKAKAPRPPMQDFGGAVVSARPGKKRRKPKPQKPPRAELLRVLRYLERRAGRELTDDERLSLLQSLADPSEAKAILDRLSG